MKIRTKFVSNSSSSSYCVIGAEISDDLICSLKERFENKELVIGKEGNKQFGWEFITYNSFFDRLNFAWLQAKYLKEARYEKMLFDVIKKNITPFEIDSLIAIDDWSSDNTDNTGYIDHQSSAEEGANIEMFENEDSLEKFLFSKRSKIIGGNDNMI